MPLEVINAILQKTTCSICRFENPLQNDQMYALLIYMHVAGLSKNNKKQNKIKTESRENIVAGEFKLHNWKDDKVKQFAIFKEKKKIG